MMIVWHGAGTDSRRPGSCALTHSHSCHCILKLRTLLPCTILPHCCSNEAWHSTFKQASASPYRLGHAPASMNGKMDVMGLTGSQQVAPSEGWGGSNCSRLGSRFLCCWCRAGCGFLGSWGWAGGRCSGLLGLLGWGRSCTGRMRFPVVHIGSFFHSSRHQLFVFQVQHSTIHLLTCNLEHSTALLHFN